MVEVSDVLIFTVLNPALPSSIKPLLKRASVALLIKFSDADRLTADSLAAPIAADNDEILAFSVAVISTALLALMVALSAIARASLSISL